MNRAGRSLAFIAGQLSMGGAEKQLYLLLRELARTSHRLIVLTLNPGFNDYWEQPIRDLGAEVIAVPRGNRIFRTLRIATELKRANVEIVQSWMFHANAYASLGGRLAGVPVRLGAVREHPSGWPVSRFVRWSGMVGLTGIVVNSKAAAAELTRMFPGYGRPIWTVPNAVERRPSRDRNEIRNSLAEKWSLRTEAPWVVGVGRLDANKNWGLLLRVCSQLVSRGSGLQLVLLGDGPDRNLLIEEANRLGIADRVRFAGTYPDASTILSAFDVLCLVSRTEGMPNVLMEAAAAALPVVSTAVGGATEIVEDGVTGYLVPAEDPASVAERLTCLVQGRTQAMQMGTAARERIFREFSVSRMATEMTGIYTACESMGQQEYAA